MSASIANTLTWFLVVFGWIITHWLTSRREQRKEIRSKLDEIRKKLIELEKAAIDFHTSDSFFIEKSRAITLSISRISNEIERESKIKIDTSYFRGELRRAITLKNFDRSSFEKKDYDSPLLSKIADSHDQLVGRLEMNYINFYRDKLF